jgi:outer membrane murein-binding lipoprotein Lpp
MGLFKKKHDPFSQRAADLNEQIAALEEQIKQLTEEQSAASTPAAPALSALAQPRLRSTAKPRGPQPAYAPEPPAPPPPQEPIFEEVDQERIQVQQEQAASGDLNGLGVRKHDLVGFWRRLTAHFRGPSTTNPKLVNYLAAGSIQGLRPMRYEKRVARNRFLFLAVIIALVLWGLVAIYLNKP